jgi:hypothetical protein
MDKEFLTFDEVKKMYPDEWVLLANPEMKNTTVLGGIVLYHSKGKKEVCYIGRDMTADYSTVTIAFAGNLKQHHKIGIFRNH